MSINLYYRTFFFFLFSFFSHFSFGQFQFARYDSIPVIEDSVVLENAWAGGINSGLFSEVDMNMDGVKDIFIFEKDGNIIRPFIRDGIGFHYFPEYIEGFPAMTTFAYLADYNCDGKEDIFAFSPGQGGMAVYKNISTPLGGLNFLKISNILNADYTPGNYNLYVAATDVPALSDIDGDGDMDILSFESQGTLVYYFKNLSMELFGNCDSLKFQRVDKCWGKFAEDSFSSSVNFPVTCKASCGDPDQTGLKHSGSTMLAIDLNDDNDKDLILGDISSYHLLELTNGGDSLSAAIITQDTLFPSNSTAADLLFPASFYLDVTGDSINDLIVTTNTSTGSENLESVWLYTNSGSNNLPTFNFQKKNFLQETMIDLGSGNYPAFFDYDADGLMDMVAGNYGYYNTATGQYTGQLALFKNTGTATAPGYTLISRDFAHVLSESLSAVYPAFGDIDNDGDQDMIIGHYYGKLFFYENVAGPGNPANFTLLTPDYKNIDVGWFAAPQLADINRDGLLDLLVGRKDGTIDYFQNTGTASVPDFNSTPTIDTFGGIDVEIPCCTGHSAPFLFEEEPGNYSLLVGSQKGTIYFYTNIDGNLNGNFTLADSILSGEFRVGISMADINGDGKYEIAVGTFPGGMQILKSDFLTEKPEVGSREPAVEVFPNPNDGRFNVQCSMFNAQYSISVYNVLGEMVYRIPNTEYRIPNTIDISNQPNGVYFLQINSGERTLVKKVVKM